jgi:PAS domain S-box-containing protein
MTYMHHVINMSAHYDLGLVAMSVLISILSAYTALDLAGRVVAARGRLRIVWLFAGASAMGQGIWSMHYIGMLALGMPMIVYYHLPTVLLSLFAAIAASFVALFIVSRPKMSISDAMIGSLFMGSGIGAMHYVGMAAMRMQSVVSYSRPIVVLSIVLAIVISLVGLVLTFNAREDTQTTVGRKIVSALVIGLAIPVMHYVGMSAASFSSSDASLNLVNCIVISGIGVRAIALISITVLLVGIGCAYLDRSLQRIYMWAALLKIGVFTIVGMLLFHQFKDWLLPGLTLWQSRELTIFFTSIAGVFGSFLFFRKSEELHVQQLTSETTARQRGELNLEIANEELKNEIKERRRTEDQLRISEARFLAAARATNDTIWEWDIKANQIWTNEAVNNQFGLKREQSTTIDWFLSLVHPEDCERVHLGLETAIQSTKDNWSDEYRVRRDNGSYAFVLDRGVIDRDTDGQALRMIGAMSDVTKDKLLEQELRIAKEIAEVANRENKLRLEQAPLPMWIYDLETLTFIDVNQAALTHYGYSRDEVMNMIILDLIPTEDVPEVSRRIGAVSRELDGKTESISRHKTKSGTLIDVAVFGRTIHWHGRPAEIVFINDITEQLRTRDYLNDAKEKAESANRSKSEFLANMSHEIRTPLNGVIGMTDLALETELTPEQREYMETVKMSADSLLIVINDILDFSKIEAGKFDLDGIEFDLRDCLEGTLKTLALRADEKGLELLCEMAADVPEIVRGDKNRLRQVLLNLVGNAIKYTSDGEIALRVQADSQSGMNSMLHFTVSDTGIGIAPEKLKAIFDPFTQADTSTTRKYGGTGLGLTISTRIVELMDGKIWVESEMGQGSQFHFTVHLEAADSKPIQLGTIASPEILRHVKVLVVDDNRTNRRILEGLLNRWEMKTTCVPSGVEALAHLSAASQSAEPFGLILTDVHMPEMDGFNLIEQIRQQQLSTATIMMLSSGGHRGDAARCEELGVAAYLLKPIRQSELREAIAKALGAAETNGSIPLITRFSLHDERDPSGILNILLAEDNVVNQRLATRLLEKRGHRVVIAANGREALQKLQTNRFDLVFMDLQMPEMDGMEATAAVRDVEKKMVATCKSSR